MIRLDPTRKQEAIEAGWQAYAERMPGQEAIYRKGCESWDTVAVCDGDQVVGALFVKNGVIHLGIVPHYRKQWASRRLIRQMLKHGTQTTYSTADEEVFLRRVRRIACHS